MHSTMIGPPSWVELPPVEPGSVDPLGYLAPSEQIAEQLLPGVTVNTERARYLSFLCWAIRKTENDLKAIDWWEIALSVGEHLHHSFGENGRCTHLGSNLLKQRQPHRSDRLPRRLHVQTARLLYSGLLRSCGLADQDGKLSVLGNKIADEFGKNMPESLPKRVSGCQAMPCLSEIGSREVSWLWRALLDSTADAEGALLSTLHGRLIDQVVSRVRRPIRRVDILSPLNSDPRPVLLALRKAVGGREYHLFTSEERVPRVDGIDSYHSLETPRHDEAEEGLRAISRAHAKMYAFHAGADVDLFWGSANWSRSAWLARGNRANADLLIHSRLSKPEWQKYLFKDLPPGHRWTAVMPTREPLRYDNVREEGGWRLLHAIVEKGRVTLEASTSRRVFLRLRTDGPRGGVECILQFRSGEAVLPENVASRLGFKEDPVPGSLHWAVGPPWKWSMVPVNDLEVVAGSSRTMDLAQQLFWEFTGGPLPRPGVWNPPRQPSDGDGEEGLTMDEEELTRSEHQGDLDRFVLEWRSVARRVAVACAESKDLRHYHREAILARMEAEARRSPEDWPQYKRDWVRELLEREWHA